MNTVHVDVWNRILELLSRRHLGLISEEEKSELEKFKEQFPDFIGRIEKEFESNLEESSVFFGNLNENAAFNKLEENHGPLGKARVSFLKRFSMAAAMIVVIVTACVYLFMVPRSTKKEIAKDINKPIDIYPPGGNATLTLADGKVINLDNNQQQGMLISQGGSALTKKNNELVYDANGSDGKILYNTVSTNDGASYKLVLADGTKVWLNTNSSIRYPVAFTGNERNVTVTGEAYFEVAQNKSKPFSVTTNDMSIHVLGTSFNVNAYPTEQSINTTLIQGSVLVKKDSKQVIIKPGEQARIKSGSEKIDVKNDVDIEEVTGWQKNQFVFRGTSLQDIMRRLQQYYGVEIEYSGKIPEATFVASFPRNEPISRLLSVLEKTGMVHFEIMDKKVIVKP